MIEAGLASENALASLQIPDEAIPHDKRVLNGYAVGLEDAIERMAPQAYAGQELYDLLSNPARFPELTQLYFAKSDQLPGSIDVIAQAFEPRITAANAQDARVQQLKQQAMQQQAAQQQLMRQQAVQQQPMAQQAPQQQGTAFAWDDGGMPLQSRQGSTAELSNVIAQVGPTQSWAAIDSLERQGAFRNRQLVALDSQGF